MYEFINDGEGVTDRGLKIEAAYLNNLLVKPGNA